MNVFLTMVKPNPVRNNAMNLIAIKASSKNFQKFSNFQKLVFELIKATLKLKPKNSYYVISVLKFLIIWVEDLKMTKTIIATT